MPGMSTNWEKQAIARLVRDSILQLCKSHQVYGGQVEVDGIICITGKSEGQELVVKVHEKLGNDGRLALTDFLTRPDNHWTSVLSNSSHHDDAEDYSIKRQRLDDSYSKSHADADSYPNLKQHLMNPSHRVRDLREAQDLRNKENSAKDLSLSTPNDEMPSSPTKKEQGYSNADSRSVSPGRDSQPPHSPGGYSSQYPFTSTPHSIFPRRIPLRTDRWSPNQPIPTVPECKPCGYTFNNFEILSDHNEAVHSVFTCQSCFKTFTSRSNLERHSRLHSGHRPYNCTICGKSFSRKDHLSNHATKHAYKCGTCSKRFSDKKMLVTHYSYDHNAILTNICDYCNKGFSSHEQYEEHLKVHPQCMGGSPGKDDDDCMPQNLSTSANPDSPLKYVCKTCDFTTADKLTLLKHQILHQDNARCYTCLSCAKLFADPLHYSDHLLIHSSDTNIFECCICRHICPTLPSLRRHEATHLSMSVDDGDDGGDSPTRSPGYDCPKCDKIFTSHFNLEEHLELHQKSESGFACTVCQEEFENYSDICTHIEQEGHYVYPGPTENGQPSPKNKRKQKLPKSVKNMEEMEQESDVEIVEPESPDDEMDVVDLSNGAGGYLTQTNNGEFVITENLAPVIEIAPDDERKSPPNQPIKRLLSQAIHARVKDKVEPSANNDKSVSRSTGSDLSHPKPHNTPSKRSKSRNPDKSAATSSETNNNNMLLSPKLMNVDIPDGPFTCSVCSSVLPSFQELEMHCFSEHNRSPCMFCSKTFAQKANRDRHVCLHTGEKPYGCPDCTEKFSRGDKLKIHRMRAHQTAFPSLPSRGKENLGRDMSVSPSVSPTASQDSAAAYLGTVDEQDEWTGMGTSENMYSAGEWAVQRDIPNEYVAVTGEWSVKEVDDSGIDNGNDITVEETEG